MGTARDARAGHDMMSWKQRWMRGHRRPTVAPGSIVNSVNYRHCQANGSVVPIRRQRAALELACRRGSRSHTSPNSFWSAGLDQNGDAPRLTNVCPAHGLLTQQPVGCPKRLAAASS